MQLWLLVAEDSATISMVLDLQIAWTPALWSRGDRQHQFPEKCLRGPAMCCRKPLSELCMKFWRQKSKLQWQPLGARNARNVSYLPPKTNRHSREQTLERSHISDRWLAHRDKAAYPTEAYILQTLVLKNQAWAAIGITVSPGGFSPALAQFSLASLPVLL